MEQQRRRRIRNLVSQLNRDRRAKNKKIDILCKDLIGTQKKIVAQLQEYNFTLDFCQAIAGQTDMSRLMSSAEEKIREYFSGCGIGVFLMESKGFEFHLFNDKNIDFDVSKIEGCFNGDLVKNICHSNAICSLDELFAMGFSEDMNILNRLSVYTVPLSGFGRAVGFILIWRNAASPVGKGELDKLCSVSPILAKAVRGCMAVSKQLAGIS